MTDTTTTTSTNSRTTFSQNRPSYWTYDEDKGETTSYTFSLNPDNYWDGWDYLGEAEERPELSFLDNEVENPVNSNNQLDVDFDKVRQNFAGLPGTITIREFLGCFSDYTSVSAVQNRSSGHEASLD